MFEIKSLIKNLTERGTAALQRIYECQSIEEVEDVLNRLSNFDLIALNGVIGDFEQDYDIATNGYGDKQVSIRYDNTYDALQKARRRCILEVGYAGNVDVYKSNPGMSKTSITSHIRQENLKRSSMVQDFARDIYRIYSETFRTPGNLAKYPEECRNSSMSKSNLTNLLYAEFPSYTVEEKVALQEKLIEVANRGKEVFSSLDFMDIDGSIKNLSEMDQTYLHAFIFQGNPEHVDKYKNHIQYNLYNLIDIQLIAEGLDRGHAIDYQPSSVLTYCDGMVNLKNPDYVMSDYAYEQTTKCLDVNPIFKADIYKEQEEELER